MFSIVWRYLTQMPVNAPVSSRTLITSASYRLIQRVFDVKN